MDVPTIMLDLHGYSKSDHWIIFDNICKKAVSKPVKGNEAEKLVARSWKKKKVIWVEEELVCENNI